MSRPLGSRYWLHELIGRGGMGDVYRATNITGAEYAVKILKPDLAADPSFVARFVQERSILMSVQGPHVVRVHDMVVEGDTLAIVMDLVRGRDLRRALASVGTYPPAELARLGAGVASGLAAVHAADVVHRDIKPANVLLDERTGPPTVRLTDFGIARLFGPEHTRATTELLGTPEYLAPEVAEGQSPGPAVDMYALGIMLYQLSCGVTPFAGREYAATMRCHIHLDPGRPEGIPNPMWDLLWRLMDKNPAARPAAGQVRGELAELSERLAGLPAAPVLSTPPQPTPHSQPTRTLPRRRRCRRRIPPYVAVTALTAIVLFAAAVLIWHPPHKRGPAPREPLHAEDPAQFVLEYYKLLPSQNRDLAWSWLTPAYRDFVGGRQYYDRFYDTVRAISFDSGPTTVDATTVFATIRFHYASKKPDSKAISVHVVGSPGSYRIDSSEH